MVIFLAGLQGDPQRAVRGRGHRRRRDAWQCFWRITLPLLTPTIFFNLVLGIIAAFQTFTSAFVATDGGPLDATLFYVLYLYRRAFQYLQHGLRLGPGLVPVCDHPGPDVADCPHLGALGLLRGREKMRPGA